MASRARRLISSASVALVAASVPLAAAQTYAPGTRVFLLPDQPRGSMYTTEWPGRMDVDCTAVPVEASGRPRITCDFRQTSVHIPSRAEIDAAVSKAEGEARAAFAAQSAATWQSLCSALPPTAGADAGNSADNPQWSTEWRDACSRKDAEFFVRFAGQSAREPAGVCMVWTHKTSETLERYAPNDWRGSDGPRGTCQLRITTTLSRRDADAPWRFRQVTTAPDRNPPSAGTDCDHIPKLKTVEFSAGSRSTWPLACSKLSL